MSGNQQDPDLMCETFILAPTDLLDDDAPSTETPPHLADTAGRRSNGQQLLGQLFVHQPAEGTVSLMSEGMLVGSTPPSTGGVGNTI